MQDRKKVNILLFDVSPFLYIAYYGATFILKDPTSISDSAKVTSVSNNILIPRIRNIISTFEDELIIPVFCYDGVPWRKIELSKEYKNDRTMRLDPSVKKNLISTVRLFPGFHLKNDREEADDLINTVYRHFSERINIFNIEPQFFVYTRDNDLMQMSNYRCTVIDPANKGGVKDREYLKKKFDGIENFKHIILHKICFGDPSDNITGIFKGCRRKPIIEQFSSCTNFRQFLELDILDGKQEEAIKLFQMIKLKNGLNYNKIVNNNKEFVDNPEDIYIDENFL